MRKYNRLILIPLFAGLVLFRLAGAAAATAAASTDDRKGPPELKPLKYRLIGPAWGGRVSGVAGVPGDPNTCYAASASGGIWKSIDGGITWKPVFDDQAISSMGSIAVAPSDANVIYAGSGEANIRGNVAAGNGIYKSIDAGKTWTHVWNEEGQIGKIVIHPTDPDTAFAAVLGHAFGPNKERGVYRTRDGGRTWTRVLGKDENTGASDVAFDPSNPNVVFAGFWQARRSPWNLQSGGPGSGLYVSRDGGDNWTQLDGKEKGKGLPPGIWGKVGVAVAPSDGRRVYALIEAEQGGLFRSDDGGETWERATASRLIRQRPWYYSTMTVHPANPNEIWFPQVAFVKSIDGGKTLSFVKIKGYDSHDIWIDPKNPKRMIIGSDAGVDISTDGGQNWLGCVLPIGQFYHVSADNRFPFHVAGSLQDIGTAQAPSHSLTSAGIRNVDWHGVGGGEAGWVVSDAKDPNIIYAGEYGGYLSCYDHRTGQSKNVTVYPEDPSGHGAEDMKYRFQWTAALALSPHDSRVVYHGGNVLFKSADGGQTWTAVSGDLTRNDKTKQKWSGGPITGDNTGVETYCTIFVIAESPVQKDLIWVGSDDGLVHVTADGGNNWKNVTAALPGIPEWGTVNMIEPSRFAAGTAYVVIDRHRLDDMKPYLLKTADFGKTWQRLDGTLPQDVYLHAIREDVERPEILYLGTERGVSFTTDGGKTWQPLKLNLPTVAVHDLAVKGNSLVVGTHGRSMWIFDHLSVIRELSNEAKTSPVRLLSVPDAVRWRFRYEISDRWAGENPGGRAVFYYWLKEAPKDEIKIEILDQAGQVVANLSSKPKPWPGHFDSKEEFEKEAKKAALPKEAGVNAAWWDLTYDGAEMIQNAKLDGGDPTRGPLLLPGSYTVRLTAGGQTVTAPMKVLQDPRIEVSGEDLKAQVDMALAMRDDITRLTRLVVRLRSVRKQLADRNVLLKEMPEAGGFVKDAGTLIGKLDDLEARLQNPKAEVSYDILAMKGGTKLYSRLAVLYSDVQDADGLPTQGMLEVYAAQKKELDGYESELNSLLSVDLAAINEAARKLNLPFIIK